MWTKGVLQGPHEHLSEPSHTTLFSSTEVCRPLYWASVSYNIYTYVYYIVYLLDSIDCPKVYAISRLTSCVSGETNDVAGGVKLPSLNIFNELSLSGAFIV